MFDCGIFDRDCLRMTTQKVVTASYLYIIVKQEVCNERFVDN